MTETVLRLGEIGSHCLPNSFVYRCHWPSINNKVTVNACVERQNITVWSVLKSTSVCDLLLFIILNLSYVLRNSLRTSYMTKSTKFA